MDENSIGEYLFSQARTVARQQGYHFRPDSENLVREVCETAARNIVRMNRADETVSEPALRNMGRLVILDLVDEMIEESRRDIPIDARTLSWSTWRTHFSWRDVEALSAVAYLLRWFNGADNRRIKSGRRHYETNHYTIDCGDQSDGDICKGIQNRCQPLGADYSSNFMGFLPSCDNRSYLDADGNHRFSESLFREHQAGLQSFRSMRRINGTRRIGTFCDWSANPGKPSAANCRPAMRAGRATQRQTHKSFGLIGALDDFRFELEPED